MYQRSLRGIISVLLVTMLLFTGILTGSTPVVVADSGTWTALSTGLAYPEVRALAIDPLTPTTLYAGTSFDGGIFRSTDSGDHWVATNTGLIDMNVQCLAIDPVTPATLYAGTFGGVFCSVNSGTTWTAVNTGLTAMTVLCLAVNPLVPATLYAGTWLGGVFRSNNSGATWTAVNTGLTAMVVFSLAVNPLVPATLYAGTWGGGVFRSDNSGATWTAVNTGLTDLRVAPLAVDPVTPTTLYAGMYDSGGSVFRSTDSGANWTAAGTGLSDSALRVLVIDPVTPTTLYAGTYVSGVFCSTDSGDTWTAMNTGLTNPAIESLAIDPFTPTTLYAGTSGGSFRYRSSETYAVTPIIAGQPDTGTVTPTQQTGIPYGGTVTFTVTPAPGCYVVASVGTIVGNTWTIDNITQDMTPMVTFNHITFSVTPTVSGPGQITPASQSSVQYGNSATFMVTTPSGYVAVVSAGVLSGNTWTIDNITQDMVPAILFNRIETPPAKAKMVMVPPVIPLKLKGVVVIFVTLPGSYKVSNIVSGSVKFCGVTPIGIVGFGRYFAATFKMEDLRAVLPVKTDVTVKCTGKLTDGNTFEASCITSVR